MSATDKKPEQSGPKSFWTDVLEGERISMRGHANVILVEPVYTQIKELCRKSGSNEVGWFGTLEVHGGNAIIRKIWLLEQEVSTVTTDIKGLSKLASQLIKDGKVDDLDKLHAWFHCHPGQSVHPSGTDETTYKELCQGSQGAPILMMIFSKDASKAYARLHFHGLDLELGWKVRQQVQEYFPNFDEVVKEERRYTVGTFRGFEGGEGYYGEFRGTETSKTGSTISKEEPKKVEPLSQPLSFEELGEVLEALKETGYPDYKKQEIKRRSEIMYLTSKLALQADVSPSFLNTTLACYDSNTEVRQAAYRALKGLHEPMAVDTLIDCWGRYASTNEEATVIQLALRATLHREPPNHIESDYALSTWEKWWGIHRNTTLEARAKGVAMALEHLDDVSPVMRKSAITFLSNCNLLIGAHRLTNLWENLEKKGSAAEEIKLVREAIVKITGLPEVTAATPADWRRNIEILVRDQDKPAHVDPRQKGDVKKEKVLSQGN